MNKFELSIYESNRDFRWRVTSITNGKIVANGGESYRRMRDLLDVVYSLFGPQFESSNMVISPETDRAAKSFKKWIDKAANNGASNEESN